MTELIELLEELNIDMIIHTAYKEYGEDEIIDEDGSETTLKDKVYQGTDKDGITLMERYNLYRNDAYKGIQELYGIKEAIIEDLKGMERVKNDPQSELAILKGLKARGLSY